MSTYLVVDVANLMFRARHVVRGDAYEQSGMALHIIFRSLKKLFKEHKADHVVLALEGGGSWRYKEYPAYKSKRRMDREADKAMQSAREAEADEVFDAVMKDFVEFMSEKTRCTVLHQSGIEGDDFIARWIQLHPNDEHIILSSDSDFIQLITDKVTLYNGIDDRLLTPDGVFDGQTGDRLVFHVDSGSGKVKVLGTPEQEKKKHDKAQKEKAKMSATYVPTEWSWEIEPEWQKKALFVKLVRGDSGDSVFSAYPGVRYHGSAKKVGINEAWEDRSGQGFHWNNFMLQSWDKLLGTDEKGNNLTEKVRVIDEFKINERIIDLTKQPDDVKDLMDTVIVQAVQKEPVGNVGMAFLKFCHRNALPNLSKEATDHAAYRNRGYTK